MLPIIAGFILDLIVGDPRGLWHPVCAIGGLISGTEKLLRRLFREGKASELIAGGVLFIIVCSISTIVPFAIIYIAYKINKMTGFIVQAVMCCQIFAVKSLKTESMKVYSALKENDIEKARYAVSMIVGRDTDSLKKEGIIRAAVETVAENFSDGIIAPMFYMFIGGPCLGFLYKAVNTLDSMVGYKNDRYMYFGRVSAYADDIFNLIPSRISAVFMIMAAFIIRLDFKNAIYIFKRDRFNHKSPNSAQTESAAAGALNVRLAGDACYFGRLIKKPYIGDDNREIEYEDIRRVNKLMYCASFIGIAAFSIIRGVLKW